MLFLLVFVDSQNVSGFLMFAIIGKIDNNLVSLRQCRHAGGFQNLVGTSLFGRHNLSLPLIGIGCLNVSAKI